MSEQRTRKFVTRILRKICSSLVKIIYIYGDSNFTQKKYNKLPKISAKNKCFFHKKISAKVQIWDHRHAVQLHGVDLIDMQIQN